MPPMDDMDTRLAEGVGKQRRGAVKCAKHVPEHEYSGVALEVRGSDIRDMPDGVLVASVYGAPRLARLLLDSPALYAEVHRLRGVVMDLCIHLVGMGVNKREIPVDIDLLRTDALLYLIRTEMDDA